MKTIKGACTAEIIEKKSRFICSLFYVENKEEIEKILKEIKKQHRDAKHHCYAYCIYNKTGIITKSNDDGEPSGTAGIPILSVLTGKNLVNVLAVVTRYFGGILLGTGGLVRAYKTVTAKTIDVTELLEMQEGYMATIEITYQQWEPFQYYCKKNKINVVDVEYHENIKCIVELNKIVKEDLIKNTNKYQNVFLKIDNLKEKMIHISQ